MKEYFSSLDQNTTEKEDRNQPSIQCDFIEVDVGWEGWDLSINLYQHWYLVF
jgi:hypothetical protein